MKTLKDIHDRIALGNDRYGNVLSNDRRVCSYCGKIVDSSEAVIIGKNAICESCAKKEAGELAKV